jgi:hypothetical protein
VRSRAIQNKILRLTVNTFDMESILRVDPESFESKEDDSNQNLEDCLIDRNGK